MWGAPWWRSINDRLLVAWLLGDGDGMELNPPQKKQKVDETNGSDQT